MAAPSLLSEVREVKGRTPGTPAFAGVHRGAHASPGEPNKKRRRTSSFLLVHSGKKLKTWINMESIGFLREKHNFLGGAFVASRVLRCGLEKLKTWNPSITLCLFPSGTIVFFWVCPNCSPKSRASKLDMEPHVDPTVISRIGGCFGSRFPQPQKKELKMYLYMRNPFKHNGAAKIGLPKSIRLNNVCASG